MFQISGQYVNVHRKVHVIVNLLNWIPKINKPVTRMNWFKYYTYSKTKLNERNQRIFICVVFWPRFNISCSSHSETVLGSDVNVR